MKYLISQHQEGISLNPLEFALGKDGELMKFDTKRSACEFLVEAGCALEDIGYAYFVGTEEDHDMVTSPPSIESITDKENTT
tara:strand:- start:363 stop:608 length:246 start_codon:yes stop_codon:yes gene_type:complete